MGGGGGGGGGGYSTDSLFSFSLIIVWNADNRVFSEAAPANSQRECFDEVKFRKKKKKQIIPFRKYFSNIIINT